MPIKGTTLNIRRLIDLLILALIVLFLLSYFNLRLLLIPTITNGGDTAGQFYAAWFMRYVLLPHGRITGWCPGNYAGYPMFEFYFPLPFLLISALSLLVSFPVAFKLVTVLGIFLMPFCAFALFKLFELSFPAPILAAVSTLLFLFMEANSMWGGNIPSTLAGEFAYGISFSLSFVFFGTLYAGIRQRKYLIGNAALLAAIGLCHACGLVFCGLMGLFFLRQADRVKTNFLYLLKLYVLAFLLMSFWVVPGILRAAYTTEFNFIWQMSSFWEAMPKSLFPFALVSIGFGAWKWIARLKKGKNLAARDMPMSYLWHGAILSAVLYLVGPMLNVPDIRFLPYLQFLLVLICIAALNPYVEKLRGKEILACLYCLSIFLWVNGSVKYVHNWVSWNYSGFETKGAWSLFRDINRSVAGSVSSPRVAYENSPEHNVFGTMRAFELFPFFSGRSTLEDLYIQSSISSPFIYLIQGEISAQASDPLSNYYYPAYGLARGVRHLKMFNTQYLLLRSDKSKEQARKNREMSLKIKLGAYEIYELSRNDGAYVVPLKYHPVVYAGKDWKKFFYEWFRRMDLLEIPIVYSGPNGSNAALAELGRISDFQQVPRVPYQDAPRVRYQFVGNEFQIDTDAIGHPLLIRVSYHPDWRVEGAERIYLASPSFMLIFPNQKHIRLYFGRTWPDYLGYALFALGLMGAVAVLFLRGKPLAACLPDGWREFGARIWSGVDGGNSMMTGNLSQKSLNWIWSFLLLSSVIGGAAFGYRHPTRAMARAMKLYDAKKFKEAEERFDRLAKKYAKGPVAARALYFAAVCDGNLKNDERAAQHWSRLLFDFWDGFFAPEACYHLAEYYRNRRQMPLADEFARRLIKDYPDSYWARVARGVAK